METGKQTTKLLIGVLVLGGLLLFTLSGNAGIPNPPEPPGPTMKTLQEIYDAVTASSVAERQGFFKHYALGASTTQELLTVPVGKRLVLLKLHAWSAAITNWHLLLNDAYFIYGEINYSGPSNGNFTHDFPDRCVVLEPGDVLKAVNSQPASGLIILLVGYYFDI